MVLCFIPMFLLFLLSRVSCVRLCATPLTAAHQAQPSLGFSRQEHWSGLPLPFPMHESEKGKWSCSVVSDSSQPHGLQPSRLLRPWNFPGKSTGVGCHCCLLFSCFQLFCDSVDCSPPYYGKDWRMEKRSTEDEMVGWHHQLNGHEFE